MLQNVLPLHINPQLLMTPPTAFGLIAISITWFYFFSGYKHGITVLTILGAISAPSTILLIFSNATGTYFPVERILYTPGESAPFMLNLAITFTAAYFIEILYRWLPKSTLYINALLAVILFIAILSISGHLYDLDQIASAQLLMPIPPTAIACFLILSLTILLHANRIHHLYLNQKILLSFFMMFVAILGANVVVYKNFNKTIAVTNQVTETRHKLTAAYEIDILLNSIQSSAKAYAIDGMPAQLNAYRQDRDAYMRTIKHLTSVTQKKDDPEITKSILTIDTLGKQIISKTDQIIARKQEAGTVLIRASADAELDRQMEQVLSNVRSMTSNYATQLNKLVVQSAYSNRGIVTGVSIASALSVLLLIFTPLFIRQTIRKLYLTQERLRKSYHQLFEEKSRAEAVLTSIGDGIFAVDTSNVITLFNQAAQKITGMASTDVLGKDYGSVLHFSADNGDTSLLNFIPKALGGEQVQVSHVSIPHKTGRRVELQVSASPVKNAKGLVMGAIIVFRDRTNEQALENAKDEFVTLASHQLRTPATATKQFLAMFLQGYAGNITEKQRIFLQEAYDNNELGINIIEELLNIARLESNQIKIKKEQVDVPELLKKEAELHAELAAKNKQTIVIDVPKTPIAIFADPNMLSMVLDNLITNALKYTQEGGTVTLQSSARRKRVTISVSDTGIGIKKENIPKIFSRFSRLEDPSKQHVSGTGIGLYLVQKIVDMHHAKITVKSKYGKGSTFILEFNQNQE